MDYQAPTHKQHLAIHRVTAHHLENFISRAILMELTNVEFKKYARKYRQDGIFPFKSMRPKILLANLIFSFPFLYVILSRIIHLSVIRKLLRIK